MSNTSLTASIVAKASVKILENELGMGSRVFRGYNEEFSKNVNGYKVGDTVSIRKPPMFTVRSGAVAATQDVTEGTTTIVVNQQKGIDFKFTSSDLTLKMGDLAERVIKPAMVKLAHEIDLDLLGLYTGVPGWVGTVGSTMNGYASFARATQYLAEWAAPTDSRSLVLSPADRTDVMSNLTGLYIQRSAERAYREGEMGTIDGFDTFTTQNVRTMTAGSRTNGTVTGAGQNVTYSGAQANLWTQSLNLAGMGASGTIAAGDVFTISSVYRINPVTKERIGTQLQQFTVTTAATADGAGAVTVTISPPIITSGAFQTVSLASGTSLPSGGTVTWAATASTGYSQNIAFHKNAFALVTVPMQKPSGAVEVARESYNGMSVRVIPGYDIINDESLWRLDILYGVRVIDPRLAVRVAR